MEKNGGKKQFENQNGTKRQSIMPGQLLIQ